MLNISFGSHQSQTIERIKALNDMYNCYINSLPRKGGLKLCKKIFRIFIQTDFLEDSQNQMPNNQTVSHSQTFFDQKNDFNFLALVQSRTE